MKRILKWSCIAVATPILVVALAAASLYIPFVQDAAVRWLTAYASEATGLDISIGRLRLTPLADLRLHELTVVDAVADTLVAAREATVDLSFSNIFRRRIRIEGITLAQAQVNTKDLIAQAVVRGRVGSFRLSDDIDLRHNRVTLNDVEGQGLDVDIALADTTVADTSASEPLPWSIAIRRLQLTDSHLRFATPYDSLVAVATIDRLAADSADIDLRHNRYAVATATLQGSVNSLHGAGVMEGARSTLPVALTLRRADFDGGRQHLSLPSIDLRTDSSHVRGATELDLNAFGQDPSAVLEAQLTADLAKADIATLAGELLPAAFAAAYPDEPLNIRASIRGNLNSLQISHLEATLPSSFFFDAHGTAEGLTATEALTADISYNLETRRLDWLRTLVGSAMDEVRLPAMSLAGTIGAQGTRYSTFSTLRQATGLATVKAEVDISEPLAYDADLLIRGLNLKNFMPTLPVATLTARATAQGTGTDITDHATALTASAEISALRYDSYDLAGTTLSATLSRGRGRLHLAADNPLLVMQADIDALLNSRKPSDLTFSVDLSRAELHALGLASEPLQTAMCLHIDGQTDLSRRHTLSGSVTDIVLATADTLFRPEDITLEALLRPDTTYAYLRSGDLTVAAHGRTSYDRLLGQLQHFADEATRQARERLFDLEALRHRLPQIAVALSSGSHNPAHDILRQMGYDYATAHLTTHLDPHSGVHADGHVYGLNTGAILLDTIALSALQDTTGIDLGARIRNGRRNPQISFDSQLSAHISQAGEATARLIFLDDRGRRGVDLGLQAAVRDDSLIVHFDPLNPIIAYRTFHINADNVVRLGKKNRVTANIDLLADDGTGLKLYSAQNEEALQDLTASVNRLNLGELMTVLPYMPHITGFLHGDAHIIQTAEHLSVSADMGVDALTYEGAALGQVGFEGVYLPNADGSHFIDGALSQTGITVATVSGTYTPRGSAGELDLDAALERLPFSLANGFIPDGLATLEGTATGDLHIGGTTARPQVNGDIATSALRILSAPYSLSLRADDDTLHFNNSHVTFNDISIYSTGRQPCTLSGDIDFANLDKIQVNATATATDFELINAKKTPQAVAYGKVYVDMNAFVRGTLDDLRVMGRLKVLGATDVTYILTDSPLTVEDQLADLVEFVDFEDTLAVAKPEERAKPQHLNVTMGVSIDNAAQIHCLLSADGSSYVDLEGGGDLTLSYSPEKDLQLNGRYTVNSGTLKYTMMVIPLKEFTIHSGSYAEFRGPLLNPTLNISATERLRTTITENQQPRSVNFDVGLNITQTLENLGLEFTIDAPEDMTIRSELATMSTEQRGRIAVTMLATGMYITDANSASSGGFSTQNALNAFLQSQISNITNKALKSVDISLGMEQGTSSTGSTTTDYSFRFAKRFWGNRISVIVGGKVSTGSDAQNTGQSLIDNVSIEYRLDQSASRYVKLFYDKNYESLLESEITEMGAGLILRRKTARLGELFLFKQKKD